MTKKLISALAALCMAMGAANCLPDALANDMSITVQAADTYVYGDYEYTVLADGTAEISKYIGKNEQVTIPLTINGKRVTSLGENAFINNRTMEDVLLTKVVIPEGVTNIGDNCFQGQFMLTDITIPSTVRNIGMFALGGTGWILEKIEIKNVPIIVNDILVEAMNCSGTLKIEDGVRAIAHRALTSDENSLTKVEIPATVTDIPDDALASLPDLVNITVSPKNPVYESRGGVLYTKGAEKLIICPSQKTELTVPAQTATIGEFAFEYGEFIKLHLKSGSKVADYAKSKGMSYDFYDLKDISKLNISLKTSYTYNGKARKPLPAVTNGSVTLEKGRDYTLTYKNNVKVGKATVTITGKGSYKGSITRAFKIYPKKTAVKKLTTPKTKQLKVSLKKVSGITGYQVTYSTSKKFTKSTTKTVSVKGASKTTKLIKKLRKGRRYYVKVRTYKTVGKVKYYSSYSAVKSIKVK